jgi:2-methylcitrate dehydratase PrpD
MHSLEFDDTHTGSIMHGSSALAPAALAAAQACGASGSALLGAYARGWEALVCLGLAAPGRFHAQGWQATSVAGVMAAALIAAELASLDEPQMLAALGISLSQAGGVMEFLSNGSSVKSLHSGWAAHGGVMAATMAASGMTGPLTALDGRWGLFKQFTDDDQAESRLSGLLRGFGHDWHLLEAAFKFYPCCHYLHPFIEAASILSDRGLQVNDIKSIACEVPAGAAPVICEPWARALAPASGHAARWSLPVALAARLVEGDVGLQTFERSPSDAVLALARKVSWTRLENARFPQRFEAVVRIELDGGRVEQVRIDDVDGNHTRPPSPQRVLDKFRRNAQRTLSTDGVARLEAACMTLSSSANLQDLGRALALRAPD